MKEKYRVKRLHARLYLSFLDFISFFLPSKKRKTVHEYQRILICNLSHLGDVILSTMVIRAIHAKYPNCKVGFLCGSWCREIVQNHPYIHWVHYLDHWKLNRGEKSLWKKYEQYRRTFQKSKKEVLDIQYDLAFDLYSFYPNSAWFLWRANIPERLGYISGGLGRLYTQSLFWNPLDQFVGQDHANLLKLKSIKMPNQTPFFRKASLVEKQKPYLILHPVTLDQQKRLPIIFWKKLLQALDFPRVYLTGKGKQELAIHQAIQSDKVISLCDQLDFNALQKLIHGAHGLITVDSMIAHISSAYPIPTVVLFTSKEHQLHWFYPASYRKSILFSTQISVERIINVIQKTLHI